MTTATVMAAELRALGFALCKPDPGTKSPTYPGWSTRSLEPEDFGPSDPIGIMAGALSNGNRPGHALVIGDLDKADAIEQADVFLPRTGMEEGREGKPRDHRYWLVPVATIPDWAISTADQGAPACIAATGHAGPFKKPFNRMVTNERVLDFLGTGGQAVCPGPDGRRQWVGLSPSVVPFLELWEGVCNLASECDCELPRISGIAVRQTVPCLHVPASSADVIQRATAYLQKVPLALSGANGHGTTFWPARAVVYGFDLGQEIGFQLLWDVYNPRCRPPWTEAELRHKCKDADLVPFSRPRGWLRDQPPPERIVYRQASSNGVHPPTLAATVAVEPPQEDPIHLTDRGNAIRLVKAHGADLRYCHPWKKWLVWDGKRWHEDDMARAMGLAKGVLARLFREAATTINRIGARLLASEPLSERDKGALEAELKEATNLMKHCLKSEAAKHLNALLDLARSEPCVPILPSTLDGESWLLNCPNGTLELKTGTLREHRREDYITKLCPVEYHAAAAACPLWDRFLEDIFPATGDASEMRGNAPLIQFVQRVVGHCLTGDVSEQILAIFWGMGANGKSTLLNIILSLLGEDYAVKANRDLFMNRKDDRHPTALAQLSGKRLVVCIESAAGGRLDEALVKELTGGDPITARRMREDYWTFDPTHKPILVTNHQPEIRGTDHAMWRRIRLVPFTVTFEEADQDKQLLKKLRSELPGILAWAVRGCLGWQQFGLGLPSEVEIATKTYRSQQDFLSAFLDERCLVNPEDRELRCRSNDLYAAFRSWCETSGELKMSEVPSLRKLGLELTAKGFKRLLSGGTWYLGLALRPEEKPEEDDEPL